MSTSTRFFMAGSVGRSFFSRTISLYGFGFIAVLGAIVLYEFGFIAAPGAIALHGFGFIAVLGAKKLRKSLFPLRIGELTTFKPSTGH